MVVQKTAEAITCASAPGYSDGGKTGMMVVAGSGIVRKPIGLIFVEKKIIFFAN